MHSFPSKSHRFSLAAVTVGLFAYSSALHASVYSFTGGNNAQWGTLGSWSENGTTPTVLPGINDQTVLRRTGDVDLNVNANVGSFTYSGAGTASTDIRGVSSGTRTFAASSITANGAASSSITFRNGSTKLLVEAGDVYAQSGVLRFGDGDGGLLGFSAVNGTVSAGAGMYFRLDPDAVGTFSGTLTNSGTTLLRTGGTISGTTTLRVGTLLGSGFISSGGSAGVTPILEVFGSGASNFSGTIANGSAGGVVSILKSGSGSLTLSGSNTYTGDTTVNEGVLQAGSDNAFGSGVVNLNAGKLSSSGTSAHTLGNVISFGGNVTLGDATNNGTLSFTNSGTLTGSRTITVASAVIYYGDIAGSGFSLTKAGGATMTLTGSNTYSGGTVVTAGTLIVGNPSGAGTGGIVLNGGDLEVDVAYGTQAISNSITITSSSSRYGLQRAAGSAYSAFAVGSALSEGTDTDVSILGGQAGDARNISAGFSTTSDASNDYARVSDVVLLTGTDGDIFVLQLQLGDVQADQYLGWLNGSDSWTNAVSGNTSTGGSAVAAYIGSYASSGASATSDYLGSWGYDTENNTVWAVLDHNGAFAAIPEPSTWLLLGLGIGVVLWRASTRRRMRNP